ncbi:hypothetical protein OI450_00575 [Pectobacterium cacticida]|uniref:Universal stress protein n=1 Tax=Pectobacterium cacticida TaxID=69221 RepID=A0ABZ2G9W7_9GAMM|nr:hypothetical protein [Pectobacterium cacticida]UYX06981.1 hypothetical protein OI450_00575 [Pectobacterium cacticida]
MQSVITIGADSSGNTSPSILHAVLMCVIRIGVTRIIVCQRPEFFRWLLAPENLGVRRKR